MRSLLLHHKPRIHRMTASMVDPNTHLFDVDALVKNLVSLVM
jgi:hypothetical protein